MRTAIAGVGLCFVVFGCVFGCSWELIRWGGNSFQFNLNSAALGQIECALPALSGMAVDFHEGGTGLAQSYIDNFRVEVCASAP